MNSLAAASLVLLLAVAQDTASPSSPSPQPSRAIEAFKAEAAELELRLASAAKEKLSLMKNPVLRWDNPARTGEDGALFVWTSDSGRPEVIGTIFTYQLGGKLHRKHEFHSLALVPLEASFRDKTVWSPKSAGVAFEPLEGAPTVAGTNRQRLTQMKSLAREFSASMRDLEGEQFQLRLLTQPLVRYEPKDKRVLDGAIFAFSLGTDPEVLLLLEARAGKEGQQWQYALARFHFVELTVFHDGRQVWRAEPQREISNLDVGASQYMESSYATYHIQRNIPAE